MKEPEPPQRYYSLSSTASAARGWGGGLLCSGRRPPLTPPSLPSSGCFFRRSAACGRKAGLGTLNPSGWEFKEALQFIMGRARRRIEHLLTEGAGLKLCRTIEPGVWPPLPRSGASRKAGSEHASVPWENQQGFGFSFGHLSPKILPWNTN